MIDITNRALIVLASYDFESLQITLQSLKHTLDVNEMVIVILNGKKTYMSDRVERIARIWAMECPDKRFVVKPICAGEKAFFAIKEILKNYEPLKDIQYICKMDDDIIPLKKGWLENLAEHYRKLSEKENIGFTTGLINNNCWGFNQLLDIMDKRKEYSATFNYVSKANHELVRLIDAGKIDDGYCGTLWQSPFLGWWVHQWTSLNIDDFIKKTERLPIKEIFGGTPYSIGCMFFNRDLWLGLDNKRYETDFDEMLIYETCSKENKARWVVMSEPMIHMFYHNQRAINANIISYICLALCKHFNDDSFLNIQKLTLEDSLICNIEKMNQIDEIIQNKLSMIFDNLDIS